MYARPARILGNCAARVVLFPSGASHLSVKVPPTPPAVGISTWSSGLLSLNGLPKKPQTTPPLTPGWTLAPAWMCAAIRLSLVSAVCVPLTSILLIVAVMLMAVSAALIWNRAVPNERGREPPPAAVGFVGGTSCEFVRLTVKSLGDSPWFASRASTYCAFVKLSYLSLKSGRLMKSLKNACLLASSCESTLG